MSEPTFDTLEQVRCPTCGHLACLETCDVPDAVTYWAEGDPVTVECGFCEARLTLHEHVTRWWHVTKGGA